VSKAQKPLTAAQIVKLRDDVDNLKARLDAHASAEDVESLTTRVEELTRTIGQIAEVAASPSWVASVNDALVDAAKRLREVEGRSRKGDALNAELQDLEVRVDILERRTLWQWLWGAR
jgi:predicted RNase H-like nuclease (RuvC/YqgF family)